MTYCLRSDAERAAYELHDKRVLGEVCAGQPEGRSHGPVFLLTVAVARTQSRFPIARVHTSSLARLSLSLSALGQSIVFLSRTQLAHTHRAVTPSRSSQRKPTKVRARWVLRWSLGRLQLARWLTDPRGHGACVSNLVPGRSAISIYSGKQAVCGDAAAHGDRRRAANTV